MNESLLPEVRSAASKGFEDGRALEEGGLAGSAAYRGSTPQPAYHGGGTSSPTDQPEDVPPSSVESEDGRTRRNQQPPLFPLNDKAASLFFSKVTDTAVMGLVTLATFFSTYLLAWGKPGTNCIPYFNTTDTKNVKYPDPSWQQIVVGLLPFVVFPMALYLSGLGKIAEIEKRTLSVVSFFCLCEFALTIVLMGMMCHCIAGAEPETTFGVTVLLVLTVIVVWGSTFKHPKSLRSFIWSTCLRRAEVEQEEGVGCGAATAT